MILDRNHDWFHTLKIINDIREVGSTNAKVELVREHLEELKVILEYTYNPFKMYKIKKIPTKIRGSHWESDCGRQFFTVFNDLLEHLIKRPSANTEDLQKAWFTINLISGGDKDIIGLLMGILTKDLKLGMGKHLLVKAGVDIPLFDIQLAERELKLPKLLAKVQKDFENNHTEERPYVFANTKYDGKRLVALKRGHIVTFLSRNGKEYLGYDCLKPEILKATEGMGDCILDGEIMHVSHDFRQLTQFSVKSDNNLEEMYYMVFDALEIDSVDITNNSQLIRFLDLQYALITSEYVHLTEFTEVYLKDFLPEVTRLYKEALDTGYEGLIIKDPYAKYDRKRCINWVKMKPCETIDLMVEEIFEGRPGTRLEGSLGGVMVDYKGVKVGVGSGFSDDLRDKIWKNPNLILGNYIEMTYMEVTDDGSLRLPIFKKIRYDKS